MGTPEYQRRIEGFRVSPVEAQAKLAAYWRAQSANPDSNPKLLPTGRHLLVIGDAYHFFMPRKTGGIPLSGYYVNGITGEVQFRNVEGSVPYRREGR